MKTVIFATLFKSVALITVTLATFTLLQWVVSGIGEDTTRLLRLTSMSLGVSIFFKILDILFNREEKE